MVLTAFSVPTAGAASARGGYATATTTVATTATRMRRSARQTVSQLLYTMSGKNVLDMFDCNIKKDYQI